jgi:hypothetical protein
MVFRRAQMGMPAGRLRLPRERRGAKRRETIMGWYRCSCGFVTEATPRLGDSIVSVSHIHQAARIDGTSSIVRMEEIPDPALERETTRTAVTETALEASVLSSARSVWSRPAVKPGPGRRAA